MKITFNSTYAILAIVLFSIELLIAIYYFNPFIRGFVGDVLVVIFLYCLLKSFYNFKTKKLAFGILVFAIFVEILQYFQFADLLQIQSKVIRIIIGTSFEVTDLLAYFLGYLIVLTFEFYHKTYKQCT